MKGDSAARHVSRGHDGISASRTNVEPAMVISWGGVEMKVDRGISGSIYAAVMAVMTVVLLVLLGNCFGIVGVVIALAVPMLLEILRSVLMISRRRGRRVCAGASSDCQR